MSERTMDATEQALRLFDVNAKGQSLGRYVKPSEMDADTVRDLIERRLVCSTQFGLARTWQGAEFLAERFRAGRTVSA